MNIFPAVGHRAMPEGGFCTIGEGGVTGTTEDAEGAALGVGSAFTAADADGVVPALAEALGDAAADDDAAGVVTGRGSNGALHDPNPVFVIKSSAPGPEILRPANIGLSFPGTRPILTIMLLLVRVVDVVTT